MKPFRLFVTRKMDITHAEEAAANGIEVIAKEFIRIVPIATASKKEEIKKAIPENPTVVLTSKNAVHSLASLTDDYKDLPFRTWQIFCLDGATQSELKKYTGDLAFAGTAINAVKLAEKIIDNAAGKKVIFFCGDKRRDVLSEILQKEGFEVTEVVIYETIPEPSKLSEEVDAIAFFSPSAVQSFFSLNKPDEKLIFFSIGTTTTGELKKFSSNKILTCEYPSEKKLLEMVVDYCNEHKYGHRDA